LFFPSVSMSHHVDRSGFGDIGPAQVRGGNGKVHAAADLGTVNPIDFSADCYLF
jgi:hypothetical protein